MPDEPPKIIVDSDWKSQAQAEKEKLTQKSAPASKGAATPSPGAQPGSAGGPEGDGGPATFDDIVRMLAMQALTFLGEVPDPVSGQRIFAPEYARRYIDMLSVLEQKTKGNLDPDEGEALTAVAADLRMAYVEMTKAVAKAVAEGRIKPAAAAGSKGPIAPGPGPIPSP